MDQNHSYPVSAQWTALRKRSDRCGMGTDCSENAAATAARATTAGRFAGGRAGDLLHSVHWLPVAGFAKRVSTLFDSSGLFLRLARHWPMAQDRQSFGPTGPTKTRPQAEADFRRHRQPKCFDDASWRPARLRSWQTHT